MLLCRPALRVLLRMTGARPPAVGMAPPVVGAATDDGGDDGDEEDEHVGWWWR